MALVRLERISDPSNDLQLPSALSLTDKDSALLPSSETTNAIQAAWRQHIDRLDPTERDTFQKYSHADLDSYLKDIQNACHNQRKTSRLFRIAEWFEPLFTALSMYMPAIATASQAYPNPSSLVLGGVTCILQMSTGFLHYQERMVQVLSKMGRKAHILSQYDQLIYRKDLDVQMALINVYSNVLAFCSKALKLLVNSKGELRGGLKIFNLSLWRPFNSQFGHIVGEFEHSLEDVGDKALLCDRKRAQISHALQVESRVQQQQNVNNIAFMHGTMQHYIDQQSVAAGKQIERDYRRERERKKQEVMRWLPSTNFSTHYDEQCEAHLEGTGQWFLDSPSYASWKTREESGLLWVKGKPGCGKSVLSALAISDLELAIEPDVAVIFVYCKSLEPSGRNHLTLACSLLKQLCKQSDSLDSSLEEKYDRTAVFRKEGPSWQQTAEAIHSGLTKFTETFIVVDGLDECEKHERFAELLDELVNSSHSIAKVLVFSRPYYQELEIIFKSYPPLIVDEGANSDDIRAYISTRISHKEVRWSQNLLENVQGKLLLKSDGMFLWVDLIVRTLKAKTTPKQIHDAVSKVPRGLEEIYDFALQRIWDLEDEENRQTALNAILWTMNAVRPLSQTEMLEVLAIRPGTTKIDEDDIIMDGHSLTALCADLITLTTDGHYVLIHASFKEFIKSLPVNGPEPQMKIRLRQSNAPTLLAEICLTYLGFDIFENGPAKTEEDLDQIQKQNVLLDYSIRYLKEHAEASTQTALHKSIIKLAESVPHRELCMQYFLKTQNRQFWYSPGTSTPLHLLAIFGFDKAAELIDNYESWKFIGDGWGCPPLDYALSSGSQKFCLWLLEDCPEKDDAGKLRQGQLPPLPIAAMYGWTDVIQKLIAHGFDINLPGGKFQTSPILQAAEHDHLQIVSDLLQAGANINAADKHGATALHYFALNGNFEGVKLLIQNNADINSRAEGFDNQTPLHAATREDYADIVEFMCSHGANPRMSWGGYEALHIAAMYGATSCARILAENESDLNACYRNGFSPLHIAAEWNQTQTLKALCEAGANVDAISDDGDTALHRAAACGNIECVRALLEFAAAIDTRSNSGWTAFFSAVNSGHYDVAVLLFERGADPHIKCVLGTSPLHSAAHFGRDMFIRMFFNIGTYPNTRDGDAWTALHYSCSQGHLEFVRCFLQEEWQVTINATAESGRTPLHLAAQSESSDLVALLIKKGALSTPDENGNFPLHLAAANGRISNIKELLPFSDVDLLGYNEQTPLFKAAVNGHASTVRLLVENGASAQCTDKTGHNASIESLKSNHLEVLQLLLNAGADPKASDGFGTTLLHIACAKGNFDIAEKLIDLGCDGLAQDNYQYTPLMEAIMSSSADIIDMLQQNGFNRMEMTTNAGISAIHLAAGNGSLEVLERVITCGVNPQAIDNTGDSALDYAVGHADADIFNRLVELGVDFGSDSNPLTTCVSYRLPGFLSYLLNKGLDINKPLKHSNMTPVTLAAAVRAPLMVKKLIKAGADISQYNCYGLSAMDYIMSVPTMKEEFSFVNTSYQPMDPAKRQTMLQQTIEHALESILALSDDLGCNEARIRSLYMLVLGYSLLYNEVVIGQTAAKFIFSEIVFASSKFRTGRWWNYCEYCITQYFGDKFYVCRQCFETFLCSHCHSNLAKGCNNTSKAIEAVKAIGDLEKEILTMRLAAQPYLDQGVFFIASVFKRFSVVFTWYNEMSERYEKWEKEYNDVGQFRKYLRPGQEFLKLIAEALPLTKNDPGDQPEKAIDSESQLRRINKKMSDMQRNNLLDKEYLGFICYEHEYLEVAKGNRDLKEDGFTIFNDSGYLTREWLTKLLKTFKLAGEGDGKDKSSIRAHKTPTHSVQGLDPKCQTIMMSSVDRSRSQEPLLAGASEALHRSLDFDNVSIQKPRRTLTDLDTISSNIMAKGNITLVESLDRISIQDRVEMKRSYTEPLVHTSQATSLIKDKDKFMKSSKEDDKQLLTKESMNSKNGETDLIMEKPRTLTSKSFFLGKVTNDQSLVATKVFRSDNSTIDQGNEIELVLQYDTTNMDAVEVVAGLSFLNVVDPGIVVEFLLENKNVSSSGD